MLEYRYVPNVQLVVQSALTLLSVQPVLWAVSSTMTTYVITLALRDPM
jgi:hypothetical protein